MLRGEEVNTGKIVCGVLIGAAVGIGTGTFGAILGILVNKALVGVFVTDVTVGGIVAPVGALLGE
jgi:hypothetical protein